ncbi:MAG: hypothetical protein HY900_31505, partial [Deltaproteobacteria bacterium]|nr:hypothetical protein [Deltaproteobacteria bacterium]
MKYGRLRRWVFGAALAGLCPPAGAAEFTLAGSPGSIMGYIDQGVTFGIDEADASGKSGFNQAVFTALLEGNYKPAPTLKLYAAGKLTADWAYPLLEEGDEWKRKEFDRSRDELYVDTGWNDILHEAHVT